MAEREGVLSRDALSDGGHAPYALTQNQQTTYWLLSVPATFRRLLNFATRDGSCVTRQAAARNDIWSMDVVTDQLADGRRFRAPTVLDLFTRECLAIEVGQSLGGQDVVAALDRLRFERGLPQRIYCDSGTEFVSRAMDLWAYTYAMMRSFLK